MTLHVSTIRPPTDEQVVRARAFDACLAEAGYPDECVSVTDQALAVSRSHPGDDDPGYNAAVTKASALLALHDLAQPDAETPIPVRPEGTRT